MPCHARRANLDTAGLFNILLTGDLIFLDEIFLSISAKPIGELGELLAKAINRLIVHVGLSDQLRQGDCILLVIYRPAK
jgi:hypothetical protein